MIKLTYIIMDDMSLEDKKDFICDNVSGFKKDDLVDLGNIIIRYNSDLIKECADGCRINLNAIKDESVVKQLYGAVFTKMNKSACAKQ